MSSNIHKVFWSWQNDYSPKTCRYFIKKALEEAIGQVGKDLNIEDDERIEIDHDTKNEAGMVDIADTIMEKIKECAVFVADVTPIGVSTTGEKALPNPNVMVELGWALNKPGHKQIIGIINLASGHKIEELPFDIRGKRILTYQLAENADPQQKKAALKALSNQLKDAIRTNLESHFEEAATNALIDSVEAKSDNFSIWSTATNTLTHQHALARASNQVVNFPDCPRSYIRVIPSRWPKGIPHVTSIENLVDTVKVYAPSDNARSGDFGACEEGYVRYWLNGEDETINTVMFFDETGEFWFTHGTVFSEVQGQPILRYYSLIREWSLSIQKALHALETLGATGPVRLEVGVFGTKNTQLYFDNCLNAPIARKNNMRHSKQLIDWNATYGIEFLTEANGKLCDIFGQDVSSKDEFQNFLDQLVPGFIPWAHPN